MSQIITKIKEQSIKNRILIMVLPVVIFSYIILLTSFYMIYVKESRSNLILQHEKNTLSAEKNAANYFSALNSNIDLLLYGTEIQSLIRSYSAQKLSPEEVQSQCNTLFSTYLLSAQSGIQRVYILLTDNGIISNQTIYHSTLQQQEQKLEQLSEYLEQPKGTLCYYYSPEEPYTITAAKNIFDIDKPEKKIGILLTEINVNFMEDMISGNSASEYSYFSLFQNDQLIYTTSPYSKKETTSMNMKYHSHMDKNDFYAVRYSINDFLQVGGLLNTTRVFRSINCVWRQLLSISIFFLLILVFAVIQISRTISQEFQTFIGKLRQTSVADETALIHTAASNEFAKLTDEYNHMLLRLQESNKKLTDQQLLLKNAEIKTLQAQINPHFLYNTLDCISSLAALGKTAEITSIVPKLANIMRMIIKGPDLLLISEDLNYVREYLDIQKMRFQDRLLFLIECSDSMENLYIPKLIIQPVVENAIIHGICKSTENGLLSIQLFAVEKDVLIKIYNTGPLFSDEVMKKIHGISRTSFSDQKSIGLMNIQMRLKSQFGNAYGLLLENMEDQASVCVTIRIPQIHSREDMTK